MTETLTTDDLFMLTRIAGMMVPASAAHGLPGADDPMIMAEIAVSAGRRADAVLAALREFGDPSGDAAEIGRAFQHDHPEHAQTLQSVVMLCYYRDPRVLAALGENTGAPFPTGNEMPANDWSLLDPVRKMDPIWRDPSGV